MADERVEQMKALLHAVGRDMPDLELETRHMFGGLGAYTRGRIFALVTGDGLGLKLSEADQRDLMAEEDAAYLRFESDGTSTRQYIRVPAHLLNADALRPWVERSARYVVTLPVSARKRRRG
jgi:TfoX/Sxy family transcriptional regulator of competence genes